MRLWPTLLRNLALGLLLTAGSAAAGNYTVVPDSLTHCTTCHGVELRGNAAVDAPRLNGMEDWYVRSQMRAFRSGLRGTHPEDLTGMEMQPQASALDDAGIDAAIAFIAAVPVRTETIATTVQGDTDRGSTLYTTCAACHGPHGQGSKVMNAPKLAGQSDWYLIRQLQKYAEGVRGYAAADVAGQQMRAAIAVLTSQQDMKDVVAYLNTLPAD